MKSLTTRLIDGAIHLDASSLEGRYMYCPREFYYHGICRREAVRDTIGRDFGKFIHQALHDHYAGHPPAEVRRRMDERWATAPVTTNPDEYRNLEYAHKVYDLYCETYPHELFDVVRLETPIAVPLGHVCLAGSANTPVLWTGRVDMLLRQHATGQLWIMDHKTTSIGGETFWTQWVNSTQMHGYVWGVEQLIGERIEGYVINALFVRKPSKTGKNIELLRQFYPVGVNATEHQQLLAAWQMNTLSVMYTLAHHERNSMWPMHTNACVRKYGTCEYHDVCRFAGDRAALLSTALYRDVTWSPLED